MQLGEAANMAFVEDRLGPRPTRRAVATPGESGIRDLALWHVGCAVALVKREIGVLMTDDITIERIVPGDLADQPLGIRIDQKLMRIEAVPAGRIVRAIGAQAVKLPGPQVG